MPEPTFRLIMPRQMGAAGTKLYVFGQEVPDLVSANSYMSGTGPDGATETILTIRMAGTPVVTEPEGTPISAESR